MSDYNYDNYKYYKGYLAEYDDNTSFILEPEKEERAEALYQKYQPLDSSEIWYRLEFYACNRRDIKEKDKLSQTMIDYIRNKIWDTGNFDDATGSIGFDECVKRCTEMYNKGVWSANYACNPTYSIEDSKRF